MVITSAKRFNSNSNRLGVQTNDPIIANNSFFRTILSLNHFDRATH